MGIVTLSGPDFFVRLIGSLCQINRLLFHPVLMLHRFPASQSGGESPMIVRLRSRRLSLVSRRRAVCSIGVAVQIIIATGLAGCTGYFPGAKTFWNEEVKKLCERDGGVTIYDRVQISKADIDRHVLPTTADGKLGVTVKELAHPEAPVFAESKTTILREWSPQVGRVEWTVIRRSDSAVVARWVSYGRHGGDFPTGLAHESSFSCPDSQQIRADLQRLFVVRDAR